MIAGMDQMMNPDFWARKRAERERDEAVAELHETEARDLDETRRLLYMVLMGAMEGERWYSISGTIVNALAHHSRIADADEVMGNLRKIRDGGDARKAQGLDWVRRHVEQITEELEAD